MNLAVPAIIGQAIDPVAQLLETAYIGRLGPVELASAAVGVSVFNIISKLFNIPLLSITTSFVAEDASKRDSSQSAMGNMSSEIGERKRLPSISSALLLASAVGVIEASALILASGLLLNIMGVSHASAMHNPAKLFLSVRALGAPAVVVSLAIQGVFRGLKDTKTPLLYSGLGSISAVILLPFFVYYLNLGLTGAALATIASQYLGMFLLVWSLSKRAVLLPPKIEDLDFVGYIKSGGMLLGRTLSVVITMTLGTSMAARQGTLAMAAHQICLQVWLTVSLLSDALAVSAQALIASSFAKLDYEKVKEVTYYVLKPTKPPRSRSSTQSRGTCTASSRTSTASRHLPRVAKKRRTLSSLPTSRRSRPASQLACGMEPETLLNVFFVVVILILLCIAICINLLLPLPRERFDVHSE